MTQPLPIPMPALYILSQLQAAGFEAYLVGGAVRDLLRTTPPSTKTDFDFTTNAKPEEIQQLFPNSYYENEFGTVGVAHKHITEMMGLPIVETVSAENTALEKQRIIDLAQASKIHISLQDTVAHPNNLANNAIVADYPDYEITTYRSQEVYDDFRRPSSFSWGKSIQEDLARRDFTINAMALSIPRDALTKALGTKQSYIEVTDYTLIDPYQGQVDLVADIIKTVGQPQDRFQEDALRMLRAIRFSVQLNMQIADESYEAIKRQASLIKNISWERISEEFMKIMASSYPAEGIELLDETGLLPFIIPELLASKGVAQGGHHTTDVWTHSIDALRHCPSSDPVVRLATLLHDVAKPQTYQEMHGSITFYNHEIVGSRTAKMIARRLRLANKDIERVFALVRYHMFYYQPHNTDAAIRRFMRKVGLDHIDDILDLREGDRLGSGARRTSWRLEEMKQRMIEQLHQPMSVTDLAINGHNLVAELHLKPGPIMGKILSGLLEKVLDNPELNTKDTLLAEAKKIMRTASQTEQENVQTEEPQ